VSSFRIPRQEVVRAADVVHIHGTHSGFFNYLALPALTRAKPVLFTVHDMWPLTGHCASNFDCDRWRTGCGSCPYLEAHPAVQRDATRLEYRLKSRVYRKSRLEVVAVSSAYADNAREGLLGRFPVRRILGAVDLDAFRPLDQAAARRDLGLPRDVPVVMVAANDLRLRHKGMDLLLDALSRLSPELRARLRLLAAGHGAEQLDTPAPITLVPLGFIEDRARLATAFAAADVFVVPSRTESFGLVAAESLACATPVVAFAVGGLPDIVEHERTGLLVKPGDPDDLARKLGRLLTDAVLRADLSDKAVAAATSRFSAAREHDEYLIAYRDAINAWRNAKARTAT
jgi:glycosyltransferase involved in cell wall biosynthesis